LSFRIEKELAKRQRRIFTLNKDNQLLWRELFNDAEHLTAYRQSHV